LPRSWRLISLDHTAVGPTFNSLQLLRDRAPKHQLTIVRRPNIDVFSAHSRKHILGKVTSVVSETLTRFNVKTPSSRGFWAEPTSG
jgi:hypothetical protein